MQAATAPHKQPQGYEIEPRSNKGCVRALDAAGSSRRQPETTMEVFLCTRSSDPATKQKRSNRINESFYARDWFSMFFSRIKARL